MNAIHRLTHSGPQGNAPYHNCLPKVFYTSINQEVMVRDESATLLDISMENQIPHLHECGGNGQCATCRVRVIEGHRNLSNRTAVEKHTAYLRKWDPSI